MSAILPAQTAEPARKASKPAPLDVVMQRGFMALLVVYWALLYAPSTESVAVERGSLLYFAYVGPILAFGLAGLLLAIPRRTLPREVSWIVAYLLPVCAVALARGDSATFTSTLITGLALIAISAHRLRPPVGLLNGLFLASIGASVVTWVAGTNVYGAVPFLSGDETMPWRISLYPFVPESAFFSAVVLLLNLVERDAPGRRLCLVLAAYFLLFSGLRSALIGTLLAAGYHFVAGRHRRVGFGRKAAAVVAAIALFVAFLNSGALIARLPAFENTALNNYLFRSQYGLASERDVSATVYRTWIWSEHLRIASANPVLGIGTFQFADVARDEPIAGLVGTGSEAFITGLYARVGVFCLLFVAFFAACVWRGLRAADAVVAPIAILLALAMLAYGSFIVPYNFVFLVLAALVCSRRPHPLA